MKERHEEEQYDWAGSRILHHTEIPSKRRVIGNEDVLIPTDLREWIAPVDSQVIRKVIASLGLPHTKKPGEFDKRAWTIWKFVAENIEYKCDETAQRKPDFWQFPPETLALGKGDCEDCAFLLASLLLASGISPFCVRVVFGVLTQRDDIRSGHSWVIYKHEKGRWVVLESTLDILPKHWPSADNLAKKGSLPRYYPDICLNQQHVWTVGSKRRIRAVASYLHSKGLLPGLYSAK
jgi:transglutaminase-like putative cysteine protease